MTAKSIMLVRKRFEEVLAVLRMWYRCPKVNVSNSAYCPAVL
jgi:hypothetical protein